MLTTLNPKKTVEPLLTFLTCDVVYSIYFKNNVKVPLWFWAFVCKQLTLCLIYYFYFLSVFDFVSFMGLMISSYFCLLIGPSFMEFYCKKNFVRLLML